MNHVITHLRQIKLKKRSDIHILRKLWHSLGVLFLLFLLQSFPQSMSLLLLFILWAVFVSLDLLRMKSRRLNQQIVRVMGLFMRENEFSKLAGTTYLLTGVLIVFLVVPHHIFVLTLLFLAFADPLASYFGLVYGRKKIYGEKTLQGSLGAFFVCFVLSTGYFASQKIMIEHFWIASVSSALIGALAELIPVGKLDDNLTLPLLSSCGLYLIFYLLGGLL